MSSQDPASDFGKPSLLGRLARRGKRGRKPCGITPRRLGLEPLERRLLLDATPTGDTYMLIEHWGGDWADAEKQRHPNNVRDDSLMCWAGAASNVLEWTSWGDVVGDTDDIFQYFVDHWEDTGGRAYRAWSWWFDGVDSWGEVDVAGGGFHDPPYDFGDYYEVEEDDGEVMEAIDDYLHAGYGVALRIEHPPHPSDARHWITCWGYNYNPDDPGDYYGVWVSDSDDNKHDEFAPDTLHYYEVEEDSGTWYLDIYSGDRTIIEVQALRPLLFNPIINADDPGGNGTDNGQADDFRLVRNGDDVEVYIDGNFSRSFAYDELNSLTVNGSGDDDSLTVDLSGGPVIPPGGIAFDGDGEQTLGDRLAVVGGEVEDLAYNATGPGAGDLRLDGRVITFTGLEPVSVTSAIGTLAINVTDGLGHEIVLEDIVGINDTQVTIDGGLENIVFTNPASQLTINAGDGEDTLIVRNLETTFTADVLLTGGNDRDAFEVVPSASAPIFINGGLPVMGDPDVPPGDVLALDLDNVIGADVQQGLSSGVVTSLSHQDVQWISIETIIAPDRFEWNDSIEQATVLGSLQKITLRDLSIHPRIDTTAGIPYADVVVVVDESESMDTEHAFLQQFIPLLEQGLLGVGIGGMGIFGENQYGLVGFGGAGDPVHLRGHSHLVGGSLFASAADFAVAAGTLVISGNTEDGYDGIDFALNNYPFRPDAERLIILVTDEDRDIVNGGVNFGSIDAALQAADTTLHGILNVDLEDGNGATALAIDGSGVAYLADGFGGVVESTGGVATGGYGTTIADYVNLVFNGAGLVGDLNQIRNGGTDAESFSNAMLIGLISTLDIEPLPPDVDVYQYTAQDTGKLIINAHFDHEVGNLDMRILDAYGNVIDESISLTDDEQIVIPVVTQEQYYIEIVGVDGAVGNYDLEIENFAAPIPDAVVLDPLDDNGWSDSDNLTCVTEPKIFIEADLFEFALEGIDVLTPTEVAAEEPGAAVEVFVNGSSVGYATPIAGTNNTLFEYTFGPGELSTTFIPKLGGGGLNFVKAAVRMFDGQQDDGGLPDPATGRTELSEPLLLTVDTTAPAATTPDLLASSDTGFLDTDNVTKINQPAFTGVAEANARVRIFANGLLVGEGMVGKDATDGDGDNGLGLWEITVEPLDEGVYNITTQVDDPACNLSELSAPLQIEIDTLEPNTALLDLVEADDSGRDSKDNVTNVNTPLLSATTHDPNAAIHIFDKNFTYRIYDRLEETAEVLLYDSFVQIADLTDLIHVFTTANLLNGASILGPLADGIHNLKLEVEDRAGNISHDFLLDVTIDTMAPPVSLGLAASTIDGIDPATTDTGIEGQPGTFTDRITSDTGTGFWGRAEADAIIRLYVDPANDDAIGNPAEFSLTVAVPEDGNYAFPNGQWNTAFIRDLNDPGFFPLDGVREVGATAEDLAGNVSEPDFLDIFIDTRGPQVEEVNITGEEDFDLFNPKGGDNPDEGPTPLVWSLDVDLIDQPVRVNGALNFVYPAANEILATTPGNIRVIGDANGIIAIQSIDFIDYTVAGDIGRTTLRLNFFEPLPDDRFTLIVSDRIKDDAGNALDGETNTAEPQDNPFLPSGDGEPGEDFSARFTVDSRPEIGVWSAGSVYVDTNGNFYFDPENLDDTNEDLVYILGYTSDYVFAGNFAQGGNPADGFDKLAAYGFDTAGRARWLIDTDNDGVPNIDKVDRAGIIGHPVAGDFDGNPDNGDEIGLYEAATSTWYLDADRTWTLDTAGDIVVSFHGMDGGFPIAGDFDGDGLDDLAVFNAVDADTPEANFTFALRTFGWTPGQTLRTLPTGFAYENFIGVRERPVAADMDMDGIDDIGLWVPDRSGAVPWEAGEWYFVISADFDETARQTGQVNTLNHEFSPDPLGNDLFAQFGDEFAVPVVGNFDPPVAGEPLAADAASVDLVGTSAGDVLKFTAGSAPGTWSITLNGVAQDNVSGSSLVFTFDGLGGNDRAIVVGNDGEEIADLGPLGGTITGSDYVVTLLRTESITVDGGGGVDIAYLRDNPGGKDTLTGGFDGVMFAGDGYQNQVTSFRYVHVYGTPGRADSAHLHGKPGTNDTFEAWPDHARLADTAKAEYLIRTNQIFYVAVDGQPGDVDVAVLNDNPAAADTFEGRPQKTTLSGDGFTVEVNSFPYVHALATAGGGDEALFYGKRKAFDKLVASPEETKLYGEGFFLRAMSFGRMRAQSTPGTDDLAMLYDSAADDTFTAWPDRAKLVGDDFSLRVDDFRYVHAYASEGDDTAVLYGSDDRDTFVAADQFGKLRGKGYFSRAVLFDQLEVHAGGGTDVAKLRDAVLESGINEPVDAVQLAWLYEFERIRRSTDADTVTIDATDEIFTAYWQ